MLDERATMESHKRIFIENNNGLSSSSSIESTSSLNYVDNTQQHSPGLVTSHSTPISDKSIGRQQPQSQSSKKTLALLDPRFTGGFRNQHMRLTGLVVYAISQNISNILLESLRYDNRVASILNSTLGRIPFEELFNVTEWNRISNRVGTHILPRLVSYNPQDHPEWDPTTALFSAVGTRPLGNINIKNFRQTDLYPLVQNCTRPYAYGSGRKVGQRTWAAYQEHKRRYGDTLSPTDLALMEALQPTKVIADAVSLITHSRKDSKEEEEDGHHSTMTTNHDSMDNVEGGMLAIHPRTELDMLKHRCSKSMTQNLTKIFEMVQDSSFFSEPSGKSKYDKVYLCISRRGTEDETGPTKLKALMDQNRQSFHQAIKDGLWNGTVRVREGGEPMATSSLGIPWDRVETVAQILDYFVAVRAKAFIGTFGSSFSIDVWTTRYVLAQTEGKGDVSMDVLNYFHGPNGVGLIGNGGLPPHHTRCPRTITSPNQTSSSPLFDK